MPRLGNKTFPYTPQGRKAYRKARRNLGSGGKTVMPGPRPGFKPLSPLAVRRREAELQAKLNSFQGQRRPSGEAGSSNDAAKQSALQTAMGEMSSQSPAAPQPVRVGPMGYARNKQGELKHPGFVRKRRNSRRFRRSQGGPVTFGGKPYSG